MLHDFGSKFDRGGFSWEKVEKLPDDAVFFLGETCCLGISARLLWFEDTGGQTTYVVGEIKPQPSSRWSVVDTTDLVRPPQQHHNQIRQTRAAAVAPRRPLLRLNVPGLYFDPYDCEEKWIGIDLYAISCIGDEPRHKRFLSPDNMAVADEHGRILFVVHQSPRNINERLMGRTIGGRHWTRGFKFDGLET
ncbi:phosphodiesterase [Striga asiatica]|uniref:Phosphodiesterase n=1 Tax=Striga asiatica TaxID=4170 RepID=A0A5A7RD51_STRAF|nr:phosphodiesterase [Striga asiatica]